MVEIHVVLLVFGCLLAFVFLFIWFCLCWFVCCLTCVALVYSCFEFVFGLLCLVFDLSVLCFVWFALIDFVCLLVFR